MESICYKHDGILNQGRVKNKKFLLLSQPEYWVYFYICNSYKEENILISTCIPVDVTTEYKKGLAFLNIYFLKVILKIMFI